MSFLITCPECEAELKVPDALTGKTVRCKKCGDTFKAKARSRDDDEPALRTAGGRRSPQLRDDDSDRLGKSIGKKRRKSKSASSLPLILGLAGGLVVLAGMGIGVAYFAGAFNGKSEIGRAHV